LIFIQLLFNIYPITIFLIFNIEEKNMYFLN